MSTSGQTELSSSAGFLGRLPLATTLSEGEERANMVTHAVAAVAAAVATVALVALAVRSGSVHAVIGTVVFGSTLLNLYLVSTLYHQTKRDPLKRLLRLLDHLSILYLIAGSYTAVALLFIRPPMREIILGCEWGLALAGTLYKVLFLGRARAVSIILYLLMGWFAVFVWPQMVALRAGNLNLWLLVGGLCYTAGLTFFGMKRLPYHHAIWHLFVIAGSICHVIGIYAAIRIIYG